MNPICLAFAFVAVLYVRSVCNIELARSKVRPCKRSSRSMGALYYLWHVRSCALSNQSQCSTSNCTGTCIVNGSIETIDDSREGLRWFHAAFAMNFIRAQVSTERVSFLYVVILLNVSWSSALNTFHVNVEVFSISCYHAHNGQYTPRTKRRPVSGGGGNDRSTGESSDTTETYDHFDEDFECLLERADLECIPEERNGHCGILCLQRSKRRYVGLPQDYCVSEGRQELVDAYRKHRAKFLQEHGRWFNVNDDDIDRRISIHLAAKEQERCSLDAWVNDMDLVIWGMEMERTVYVVRHGEAFVDVFLGSSVPCQYKALLKEFTPDPEDIVIYFVDGIHFDTLLYRVNECSQGNPNA